MRKVKVIIGITISVFFIFLLGRNLNLADIGKAFYSINYSIIIPAVLIQISSYWIRSVRWKYILSGIKPMKTKELLPIISISYMANNLLPLRIGEFVRAYLVSKKGKISAAASFSTIMLERIYDGITLLLFLGFTALFFPFPNWVKQIGILTTLLFLGALIFSVGIVSFRSKTMQLVNWGLKIFPKRLHAKLSVLIDKLIVGLEVVKNKRALLPIAFYSILIWLMEASLFYAIAEAFDFSSTVYIALFTLVIVNLGIMIPSSPGYIGTFEFFVSKSLGVFGIIKELALGYSVILRITQYIPITIIGFIFMLKEGLSFKAITKLSENEEEKVYGGE